jgi:prepilin-type N-terminal cleavage/methylation domain-containing protein
MKNTLKNSNKKSLNTILNSFQTLVDVDKHNKLIAKFAKQGIKRFRVGARNDDFFVISTTLTVILNLIQNLFDTDKQNETVAKCCEKFTSLGGGCHAVTGEGKSYVIAKESKKKAAFTLAEVLITLGIIGVVAAMTVPSLLTANKAQRFRAQFNKSLSTIQQVVLRMQDEGDSLDPKDYSTDGFYKAFAKYLKVALDCGTNATSMKTYDACYTKTSTKAYKTLDGTKAYTEIFDDGQLVLQDGANLLFENPSAGRVWIHVDLNGFMSPPNVLGYDLFTFQLVDGKILPMGDMNTTYNNTDTYCNKNASHNYNGIACAKEAQSNTDYFKRIVKEIKVR